MGGQACVFYGAAEFSRDSDFAILADAENLDRLRGALTELRAGVIAVPPFNVAYLEKGHGSAFQMPTHGVRWVACGCDVCDEGRRSVRVDLAEACDNRAAGWNSL